jgi:hypothetical protein
MPLARAAAAAPASWCDKERKSMWLKVQDLTVYQRLCRLHLRICDMSHTWPLYMASLKGYVLTPQFETFRCDYEDCIRMLNGLEKKLERHLPPSERRWPELHPDPSET